jgi:pathogenesis-related protein 1
MEFSKSLVAAFAVVSMALAIATTASAQNTPQDFVNLHNRARAADRVGPVTWDCQLVHSGGPFGENLFWGSAGRAWSAADALRSWVDEKKNYHLDTNTCDPGKVCGHYTQVVWRKSTRIGCARVVCAANRGVFIICSYDPPGNFNGERPFLALDAAAK